MTNDNPTPVAAMTTAEFQAARQALLQQIEKDERDAHALRQAARFKPAAEMSDEEYARTKASLGLYTRSI